MRGKDALHLLAQNQFRHKHKILIKHADSILVYIILPGQAAPLLKEFMKKISNRSARAAPEVTVYSQLGKVFLGSHCRIADLKHGTK